LLEINASPSLTASGKEDYDLKTGLLHDVLNVLDLENRYGVTENIPEHRS
jgi:tubulin polyglutamylase TTLL9